MSRRGEVHAMPGNGLVSRWLIGEGVPTAPGSPPLDVAVGREQGQALGGMITHAIGLTGRNPTQQWPQNQAGGRIVPSLSGNWVELPHLKAE